MAKTPSPALGTFDRKSPIMATFDLVPRNVPRVETRYRRIVTEIPVPESIPILTRLRQFEPMSMSGQPPVLWDRAEGI